MVDVLFVEDGGCANRFTVILERMLFHNKFNKFNDSIKWHRKYVRVGDSDKVS